MADGNITVEVSTQAAQAELERLRALLRQALDALEVESEWGGPTPKGAAAIASLREALGPNDRAELRPAAREV